MVGNEGFPVADRRHYMHLADAAWDPTVDVYDSKSAVRATLLCATACTHVRDPIPCEPRPVRGYNNAWQAAPALGWRIAIAAVVFSHMEGGRRVVRKRDEPREQLGIQETETKRMRSPVCRVCA